MLFPLIGVFCRSSARGSVRNKLELSGEKNRGVCSVVGRLLAVLTIVLVSSSARADEAAEARLIWESGDSMTGQLLTMTPDEVTWKSPLFADPVRIQTSVLEQVSFPPADPDMNEIDEFRITLHNADTVFGRLSAIDDNTVTIESSRHGNVVLDRRSVGAIRRINHEGLIYLGPSGRTGWTTATGTAGLDAWKEEVDGALSTSTMEASLVRTLRAEPRMALEVLLRFTQRPDFTLTLGDGDGSLGLEVWEDALVAISGDVFEEIQVVTHDTQELHLHLYVDFEKKRVLVYGPSGRRMGEIQNDAIGKIDRRLTLRNGNGGVSLQHLRIGRWNGEAVDTLTEGEIGIQQLTGDVQRGRLESLSDGQVVLSIDGESTTVPLAEISMLTVTPPESAPDTLAKPQTPAARIKWRDGGRLSGEVVRIAGEQATMKTAWSDRPVTATIDGLQEIRLTATEKTESAPDRLTLNEESLQGHLIVEDGEKPILWRPTGGLNGVELTSGRDAVIVRGLATQQVAVDPEQWPDVLYLTNDDVIPCRIVEVGKEKVRLKSPFVDAEEVSSRDIKAVELASSGPVGSRGFEDAEWKRIRGRSDKAKGIVTLSDGTFGHPSAMTGDRIGFKIRWPDNYTVFSVHVYADNLKRPSTSTSITFITNQNNVFISGDKPDPRNPFGMMQNPGATRVFAKQEADVELVTRRGKLELFMDGESVHEIPLNPDGAGHSGVLFELNQTAGGAVFFNGNRVRNAAPVVKQLTLSEFRSTTGSGISIRQFIEEESRRRALTIPRFRRDDPPTHVLIAPNGDLLRGRLLAVEEDAVRFESQLEEFRFERERVASIVWLHDIAKPPRKDSDDPGDDESDTVNADDDSVAGSNAETPAATRPANEIQALLNGGFILSFTPEVLSGGILKGRSSGLAAGCLIPASSILELYLGDPQQRRERAVYAEWQAQQALEPDWDIPEGDGGSASGKELIGQAAPDFELPQLDGETFRLADHAGKVVVLDFWASWCGPCVLALPDYIDATREFEESELTFVAVNLEESAQQIRAFMKKKDLDMRVALDAGAAVASDYQVSGIPHTVIIGPDGTVEYVHIGYDSNGGEELHRIAKEILAGTWDRAAADDSESGDDTNREP